MMDHSPEAAFRIKHVDVSIDASANTDNRRAPLTTCESQVITWKSNGKYEAYPQWSVCVFNSIRSALFCLSILSLPFSLSFDSIRSILSLNFKEPLKFKSLLISNYWEIAQESIPSVSKFAFSANSATTPRLTLGDMPDWALFLSNRKCAFQQQKSESDHFKAQYLTVERNRSFFD